MKRLCSLSAGFAVAACSFIFPANAKVATAVSPSGLVGISVEDSGKENMLFSVTYDGRPVLEKSQIGMSVSGKSSQQEIKKSSLKKNIKESITAPFSSHATV